MPLRAVILDKTIVFILPMKRWDFGEFNIISHLRKKNPLGWNKFYLYILVLSNLSLPNNSVLGPCSYLIHISLYQFFSFLLSNMRDWFEQVSTTEFSWICREERESEVLFSSLSVCTDLRYLQNINAEPLWKESIIQNLMKWSHSFNLI